MLVKDWNAEALKQAFNGRTFEDNRLDIQDTPLYDTITLTTGQSVNPNSTSFFTNVTAASGKTLADTNMTRNGELSAPEMFSIKAISIIIWPDISITDMLEVTKKLALSFTLGKKVLIEAPIPHFGAGGGISAFTTATATSLYSNGVPSQESFVKLAAPIVIESNVNFSAQLQGTAYTLAGAAGMRMQLKFSGLYAKGVQ